MFEKLSVFWLCRQPYRMIPILSESEVMILDFIKLRVALRI